MTEAVAAAAGAGAASGTVAAADAQLIAPSIELETEPAFVLRTERLVLRPPGNADAPAIYEGWASDVASVRFMGWPRHTSLRDTLAYLELSASEWQQQGIGPLLLLRISDGEAIGSTGLHLLSVRAATTGYILRPDARGQGFVAEALQAIIALARWRGLAELVAGVHPENHASLRVLERAGFKPGSGSEQACCTFYNLPKELQAAKPNIPEEYILKL